MRKPRLLAVLSVLAAATTARSAVVSIPASQDAVIYQEASGALANGAGTYLHAGMSGPSGLNRILRSLVRFDVAGNVPAGAVITSATLRVVATKPGATTLSLYRVTDSWSEGPTDASSGGGGEAGGAASAAGDVTWIHRAYNTQAWASAGGDFDATARASASAAASPVEFASAALMADVQAMLDTPAGNFGWMIRNDNEASKSIQMASRSNTGQEPVLEVGYALAAGPQPVLYYDFEEAGGTEITNKAAGGTNGVLSGAAAAWVAGAPGGFSPSLAMSFDGVHPASGGVWVDSAYVPNGLSVGDYDYTFCAWINFTKSTGDCFIVGQTLNGANFLHFGVRNRNAYLGHYGADLQGVQVLDTGVWYHVAWVFEGGRTSGVQRLFVNGVADRVVGDRIKIREVETNRIIVGSADGNSGSTRSFKGAADDLLVYPTALTESQIAFLAGGGNPMNVPDPALADRDFFTAPYGTDGTWNLYERIGARHGAVTSWYGAYLASTARVAMIAGVTSTPHLVAIRNAPENEFIRRLIRFDATNYVQSVVESCWIGLTDDTSGLVTNSCAEGGDTNVALATRRAAFSNWVDGTVLTYTNWNANEPNDAAPGEDGIELTSGGGWNDQRSGVPGSGQDENSVDNLYVIEWDVNSPVPVTSPSATVRKVQAALPATLPGTAGTNDSFGGYWLRSPAGLGEIRNGIEQLLRSTVAGYGGTLIQTNSGLDYINGYDPDRPADLNLGFFASNRPYFGQAAGVTDINFVVVYKGTVRIRAADAGVWTFGVRSDDGFALRLPGHDWQRVSGLGWRDHADPSVMGFEYGTGDANTRGTVNLGVGDHPIEFVVYNGTGGNFHELYAAKGDFTNDADTTTWLPVGFLSTNGLATPGVLDPGSGLGWTVWHSVPNTVGTVGDTNTGWNAVQPSVAGDSNKTQWASINFYDLGSGATPASGSIGNSARFPYDVEQTNNTEINVALFMTSTLVIPLSGTYHLGFQGDDGSWLRVVGRNWDSIAYQAIVGSTVYIEGDKLVCNQGTGNSRTIGAITLDAGTYTLESLWWQGGGGAHYEILGASAYNPLFLPASTIPLLGTGTAVANPIAGGLQLVSTGAPPVLDIAAFARGPAPGTSSIAWSAERGATYSVGYATNLLAPEWAPLVAGIVTDRPPVAVSVPVSNALDNVYLRIERTLP